MGIMGGWQRTMGRLKKYKKKLNKNRWAMEGHWDDVEGHQARHWVASKKMFGDIGQC
jgi:hypothetical protein